MDLFTNPSAASVPASGEVSVFESRQSPGKVRSACDRCHKQKLRCIRKTPQVSCGRCLKLKTLCHFSPRAPRASLKPPERATGYTHGAWNELPSASAPILTPSVQLYATIADVPESDWLCLANAGTGNAEGRAIMRPDLCCPKHGDSAEMQDMYWPGTFRESRTVDLLDHDDLMYNDLTPFSERIVRHASIPSLPDISDSCLGIQDHDTNDRLGSSLTSAVQKLASLNVALYECSTNLPFIAEAGVNSAGVVGSGVRGSRKARLLALDDLFRLTTEFIDIMECLSLVERETGAHLSSMDPKQLGAQSARPLVAYSHQLSHACQPVTRTGVSPPSRTFSQVSEATMFVVLSCHLRITEIYVSIFQMMQACIEHSLASPMDQDWAIILPRLQVGSLASPPVYVDINTPLPSANESMYMLMIATLSSELWGRLADAVRARVDVPTNSASASGCALADTMWRTDRLSQTIEHLLQRCSVVAG